MVYLAAIAGLIMGFFAGQLWLSRLLAQYTKQQILDMMQDKSIRTKYGLLNWIVAIAGAVAFVLAYKYFITGV